MDKPCQLVDKPRPKSRRIHTKSRNGCLECKRRHIRCDEKHPKCDRCVFSNRYCEYAALESTKLLGPKSYLSASATAAAATTRRSGSDHQHSASLDGIIHPGGNGNASATAGGNPRQLVGFNLLANAASSKLPPPPVTEINLTHLELLHHFETETCRTIAVADEYVPIYQKSIMAHGLCDKHLMYQILALSALHLSLERPSRRHFYHVMASELQSKALDGWHQRLKSVDRSNCLQTLLFSHLIAVHVLCDTFNALNDDFNVFLERLVGGIRLLHRMKLATSKWHAELRQSELGALMDYAQTQRQRPKPSLGECEKLHEMIGHADLSASSIQTCHEAVNELQFLLDIENSLPAPSESSYMILAWLVTATADFTDLLDQRKPEALVILAYYAVLLHRRRNSWVICDAGSRLFHRVSHYLGQRWQSLLAWPLSAFGGYAMTPTMEIQHGKPEITV